MTTNHHIPITVGAAANVQKINDPLAQLDQAISDIVTTERDGHIIQDEGVDLAQQQRINFAGAGVTATNDAGNNRTLVTIPGGITDHGALSGLSDDDHPQYMLATRGATKTTAVMSVYVDKAAAGLGTGVDYANAFTTIQAAIDSLPDVIAHAVTIYVRKGTTPYREQVSVSKVISTGSIVIRGEYYWSNQAASNATANRLVKAVADDFNNVEVGDKVYLLQYSGTYQGSVPSGAHYGTVTDVTNKASGYITISMGASVTPTVGWQYVIAKTEISASDDGTTPTRQMCVTDSSGITLRGLVMTLPTLCCVRSTAGKGTVVEYSILLPGANYGFIFANGSANNSFSDSAVYSTAARSGSANNLSYISRLCNLSCYRSSFFGSLGAYYGVLIDNASYGSFWFGAFVFQAGSTGIGAHFNLKSTGLINYCLIQGFSAGDKLGTGIKGEIASAISQFGNTFTNVTTNKTPATWGATTDGSFVS